MKLASLFFSLLLACSCWAQPAPINRRAMAISGLASNGPFTPQSIPGLAYWWVASDTKLNTNSSGRVTNWIDRIQSSQMVGTTNLPIWSNTFLMFFKTNRLYPQGTITLKITSDTSSTSEGLIVDDNQDSSNGAFIESTPNQRLIGLVTGSPDTLDNKSTTIGSRARNSPFDIIVCPNGITTKFFTNGVFARDANASGTETVQSFGNFVGGKIYEIQIWTNTGAWSSPMIASLHKYSTNTYGYTP